MSCKPTWGECRRFFCIAILGWWRLWCFNLSAVSKIPGSPHRGTVRYEGVMTATPPVDRNACVLEVVKRIQTSQGTYFVFRSLISMSKTQGDKARVTNHATIGIQYRWCTVIRLVPSDAVLYLANMHPLITSIYGCQHSLPVSPSPSLTRYMKHDQLVKTFNFPLGTSTTITLSRCLPNLQLSCQF